MQRTETAPMTSITVLIWVSVLATAIISGVLGMAGGMILMLILVMSLGVAGAMMLHGAVQATSNGARAWFLRAHIQWQLLPAYILGAALALAAFTLLALVPPAGLVLILVGVFPWIARFNRHLQGLDVTHRPTTVVCGFVVTAAQLLAGASGPLLDVFYVRAALTRQEVVATKAITQTLGHVLKIGYYGAIVAVTVELPWWLYVSSAALAVAGARIGTRLLARWNDADFQRVSQWIILTVAAYCVGQGLWLLLV